jgi:hypothetical protein
MEMAAHKTCRFRFRLAANQGRAARRQRRKPEPRLRRLARANPLSIVRRVHRLPSLQARRPPAELVARWAQQVRAQSLEARQVQSARVGSVWRVRRVEARPGRALQLVAAPPVRSARLE